MRYIDLLRRHRGLRVTIFLFSGARITGVVGSVAGDSLRLTDACYPSTSDWNEESAERFEETIIEFSNILSVNSSQRVTGPSEIEVQIGPQLVESAEDMKSRITQLREQLRGQQEVELPYVRIRNNNSLDPFAVVVRADDEYIPQKSETAEDAISVVCAVLRTISDRLT